MPVSLALFRPALVAIVLVVAGVSLSGCGDDVNTTADPTASSPVSVEAWIEVPANPTTAAARLVIDNHQAHPDHLIAVSSPDAASAGVHRSKTDEHGRATMDDVASLEIPADSTLDFSGTGLHVMITGLRRDLEAGDSVTLVLTFETAAKVTVAAEVVEPGTTPGTGDGHNHTEDR
jgi:copper(I)-binding protein